MLKGNAHNSELFTDICLKIILTAWILNILISVTNTAKNIIGKVKEWIIKRRIKRNEEKYKTKTVPERSIGTSKLSYTDY